MHTYCSNACRSACVQLFSPLASSPLLPSPLCNCPPSFLVSSPVVSFSPALLALSPSRLCVIICINSRASRACVLSGGRFHKVSDLFWTFAGFWPPQAAWTPPGAEFQTPLEMVSGCGPAFLEFRGNSMKCLRFLVREGAHGGPRPLLGTE